MFLLLFLPFFWFYCLALVYRQISVYCADIEDGVGNRIVDCESKINENGQKSVIYPCETKDLMLGPYFIDRRL